MKKPMAASASFLVLLVSVPVVWCLILRTITVTPDPARVDETAGSIVLTVTNSMLPSSGFWGFTYETDDTAEYVYSVYDVDSAGDVYYYTYTADESDYTADESDYTPVFETSRQVPFDQNTSTITIAILDDTELDPGETFLVKLTSFLQGEPDMNVKVTIIDDERAPVQLKQPADIAINENASNNITLTLERNDTSTHSFTLQLHIIAGTADAGTDFAHFGLWLNITFAENVTRVTTTLASVISDLLQEPTEVFTIFITGTEITNNITVAVTISDNDAPDSFHCGRGKSQPCLNSGTCNNDGCLPNTGFCNCSSGFEGVNCGIETSTKTTNCSPACVNGTCVEGTCICDPGFAGDICDKPAYFHQCNPANFSVCITPLSVNTFGGDIYVHNFKNVSACNLTLAPTVADPSDGIVDWCKGYAAVIPYNGTCGELGPSFSGNVTSYVLQLFVQYTRDLRQCTDEKVTFTCEFNNNSLEVNYNIGVEDQSGSNDVTSFQGGTSQLVPANMDATAKDGNPLPSILALGTDVKITLSVQNVPGQAGIIIHSITVQNNRAGLDKRSLSLYNYGRCVAAEGNDRLKKEISPCQELSKSLLKKMASKQVILCNVTENSNLEQSITLTSTNSPIFIGIIVKGEISTGGSRTWMVPAVVGIGCVAIAVTVIAIFLGVIITRRRRRSNMKQTDDKSYYTH